MSPRAPFPARTPMLSALVRFWRSDKGLSIFFGLLVILIFVLPPSLPPSRDSRIASDVAFALVLISGVLALSERGLAWRLLMATAVVAIAVAFVSRILHVPLPVLQVAALASFVLLLLVVLGQTFRSGPVNLHRMLGGIAAYLLLGLAWAEAFALIETLSPGSFSGAVGGPDDRRTWGYFSFVTLTTVGYGDILPVHPAARSLAMLEAVVGPLYIAILLARLVSLTVPGAPEPRAGSHDRTDSAS